MINTHTHVPLEAAGATDGLLSEPAGLRSAKLSGNIPVTPLRVPSHHPSSTWTEKATGSELG